MVDYLNRMVNELLKLPKNIVLKSIDFDNDGRYWLLSDGRLLSVCREEARYKHFTDNGRGYYQTEINKKKYYLHRLLALTFNIIQEKEKIKDNCVVHHIDYNNQNNKLDNLCILTKEKHYYIHKIWRELQSREVIGWERMPK